MKNEIPKPAIFAVAALLIVAIAAFFFMSSANNPGTVDLKTIDPADLKDDEPIRRGQPGYRERITDPVSK